MDAGNRRSLGFARDDKLEGGVLSGDWLVDAGNCRSLGFARDDKLEGGALKGDWLWMQETADPSASLGMTKGRAAFSVEIG